MALNLAQAKSALAELTKGHYTTAHCCPAKRCNLTV